MKQNYPVQMPYAHASTTGGSLLHGLVDVVVPRRGPKSRLVTLWGCPASGIGPACTSGWPLDTAANGQRVLRPRETVLGRLASTLDGA